MMRAQRDGGVTLLGEFGRDQRRRGLRTKTITTRRRILTSLERTLPGSLERATTEQVEAWLDSCRLSKRSRYTYLSSVAAFFEFAKRRGIKHDPTTEIVRPRLSRLVPRPATAEDIEYAISVAEPKMRAWLCLCTFQGFRCVEVANLQRENILEDHEPPLIVIADGKGGHQAVLTLNEHAEKALRNFGLPRSGYLFLNRDGDPYKPETVSRYISGYLRSLEIDATAHQLRHLFGTLLWMRTKDLRLVQEQMRHADPRTTAGYTQFDHQAATRAMRTLRLSSRGQASLF